MQEALGPGAPGTLQVVAPAAEAGRVERVLMPVLLRVIGRHAWALPRWLDRVLPDVTFGYS